MIAALLVVFAVATMGMIHVQLDLSRAREQRGAIDTKRAFYMAEAGLAEGFNGIASGKSGNVGTEDEPARFANGVFFTTADDEGDGRVTLTSTGMCGAGRATLSIVIERTSASAHRWASSATSRSRSEPER
jgi:Tfp pilus assembly protein PilX